MRSLLALAFFILTTISTQAQDSSRAILVLDGSGSMWGQIDGKAKITIAQEVIGGLLDDLPATQELGLAAYGHRTKGDCSDIETIITPGGNQRAAIAEAVNGISPKGKTPMTDAVIAAAEALRYTEERATVILVSDGIETCNPDPCAAARALEEAGVDFTAHVVGFNIADPDAIAQMQCLAAETGGTFLTADNADELAEALVTVAAAPEPEPEPVAVEISFEATLGTNGPSIARDLVWSFANGAGETSGPGGGISRSFLPGEYTVTVLRIEDEASVSKDFVVDNLNAKVVLVLPKIVHQAEISAVETAPIGATIDVTWRADDVTEGDYISVSTPDQRASGYKTYSYVKGDGTLAVTLPLEPGQYELRYVRNAGGTPDEVLAVQAITLTEIAAVLEAQAEVGAGSEFDVNWDGPGYQNDYISIALPGEADSAYLAYDYTGDASPATLKAPQEPGTYELRYVANGSPDRVLGVRPIEVVATTASLTAVDQAIAGSVIEVTWEGPDNRNDYVTVAKADQDAHEYAGYTYTNRGTPAELTMPLDPGMYELRYIANGNPDVVLATRSIEIIAPEVKLEAAEQAVAGSVVAVDWSGPDNKNDYISVADASQDASRYANYRYVKHGSPAEVTMPLDPGIYELRYVAYGNPNKVLATRTITIVAAEVSLDAAKTAVAASVLDVTWQGPDNQNDYISIALAGQEAYDYESYRYTKHGNPAELKMPLEPGEYELRYIGHGNPKQVLASRTITIEAASVVLDAPAQGVVGSQINVSYVGPDNQNDLITIAEIGSDAGKYLSYSKTARANPAQLQLPDIPGTYLIRYVGYGNPSKILARRSVKVVPAGAEPAATAVLEAADQVAAEAMLEIFWVGPDADGDYVMLSELGSNDALSQVATANGNPVLLQMPADGGSYMLHYFSAAQNGSIGSRPVTVK